MQGGIVTAHDQQFGEIEDRNLPCCRDSFMIWSALVTCGGFDSCLTVASLMRRLKLILIVIDLVASIHRWLDPIFGGCCGIFFVLVLWFDLSVWGKYLAKEYRASSIDDAGSCRFVGSLLN